MRAGLLDPVAPAAPSDPEQAMSSPESLPIEINRSAERGELQKVVRAALHY